jgi:hypothetical protein
MTKALTCLSVLVFSIALPPLNAGKLKPPTPFQSATITAVQKQEVFEPAYSGGDNPADAPLQSEFYAYQVAVHTTCNTYVARYESPYDYLPYAFAANHQIPVQIEKHSVNFDLGFRQMKMPLVQHKTDEDSGCRAVRK